MIRTLRYFASLFLITSITTPHLFANKANGFKNITQQREYETKAKKGNAKKSIEILTTLPGVGAKSAKALYEAGFKTTKAVIAADEKDLRAVTGVGINLVKKLKKIK